MDNIGLNGLLIVEDQTERDFFITAAPMAPPGVRQFHLRARADDGQASRPAIIHVLPAGIGLLGPAFQPPAIGDWKVAAPNTVMPA